MSTEVKRRRGTQAEHDVFTGAQGEITVNTDTNRMHLHDAITVGGYPHAKLSDVEEISNDGDSQLAGGPIWPLSSQDSLALGVQSTVVSIDADRFRVNTGSEVELLYLWEPSGTLPSAPFTIEDIQSNNISGYQFTIDGMQYEFVDKDVYDLRGDGNVVGWGAQPDNSLFIDTLAFQSALDAANDISGQNRFTVFIPPGNGYVIDDTLLADFYNGSIVGAGRRSVTITFTGDGIDFIRLRTLKTEVKGFRVENSSPNVPRAVIGSQFIPGVGSGVWNITDIDVRGFQFFFVPDPTDNGVQADTYFRGIDFGFDNAVSFMRVEHSQGVNYRLNGVIAQLTSGPVLDFEEGGCLTSTLLSVRDCAKIVRVTSAAGSNAEAFFNFDGIFVDGTASGTFIQYVDAKSGTININGLYNGNTSVVQNAPYVDISDSSANVYLNQCSFPNVPGADPYILASGKNNDQKCNIEVINSFIGNPSQTVTFDQFLSIGSFTVFKESKNINRGRLVQKDPDEFITFYTDQDLSAANLKTSFTPASNDWNCTGSYTLLSANILVVGGNFDPGDEVRFIIRRDNTNIGGNQIVNQSNGRNQNFVFDQFSTSYLIQKGEEIEIEIFKNSLADESNIRFQITLGMAKS